MRRQEPTINSGDSKLATLKPPSKAAQAKADWLERMYNNRALVPEHPQIFARWAADSARARAQGGVTLDIPYGNGLNETLDLFQAQPAAGAGQGPVAGAPVVVFIHGGYWRSLDKSEHSFIAPTFTAQGACVVVPNYALCPAVTVPDITLQMVQAVAWVHRHIAAYGGDPGRICVIGHSAGGHLAAMLLACQWKKVGRDLPADLVKSALSISGLYELEPMRQTPSLQASLKLTPQQVAKVSPVRLPRPPRGQLATVAGGDESAEFQRQNGLMQQAWGKARVPVADILPARNHFTVVDAMTEPGHRLFQLASQLALG